MQKCLEQLDISGSTVLADKAYGSWENREYIANHDADFCIPPKSNSVDPWYTDFYHYKERHLVECFFMKIKDHRRIAMRFEKLACRFLAFILWRLLCSGLHNFACWWLWKRTLTYRNSTLLPHLGHTCFFNVHKMDWHHKCILLHHYFSLIFPFALFQFVSFHQSEFFFCMSDNKTLSK